MKCEKCGNQQDGGKFCGKCGTSLTADHSTANPVQETVMHPAAEGPAGSGQVQQNEYIEKAKKTGKGYWSYLKTYIKTPSAIFSKGENEFVNGLISLLLFSFMVALVAYVFIQSISRSMFGGYGDAFMNEYAGPTFISVFGGSMIYAVLSLLLAAVSLFVVTKLFGKGHSFKSIISYYGSHMLPGLFLMAAAFIFILIQAYAFGTIILTIAISFTVFILPLYLISSLLTKQSKSADPLYGFISYVILFSIAFSLFSFLLADSAVGSFIDDFGTYL
ncbi:zinc ribbon domain-containing protein [Jeotgalibacillus sp. ET6]|uniref:zinc ribbon domain-containing protein n=1 Tax=Jeotgalibacillus sp. ET6 TaxID=3037260 RepID=UPI0024189349|nr:zinc ribbon domain-containing protein [Jeotgalibacillus sp. ET6]MDG5471451.1 zinc ribbon domain-containing protein [Jeotgalibacillus sp. ET6]